MTTPSPPSAPDAPRMQQVTIFIGEEDHWQHRPLYLAILERLREEGGAGATVLKGLAGYGGDRGTIHTTNLVDVAAQLPLVILWVDTAARVAALLPALDEMVAASGGVLTVVEVTTYRARQPGPAARGGDPLKVRQIMETHVVTVAPDTPVADLLPLLLNKPYKALPVVDAGGRVLGMVTDVDLLEKADIGLRISVLEAIRAQGAHGFAEVLQAAQASYKTARDVMGSRPAAVIGPDASVGEAARRMVEHGVKRLPVVDHAGHLLGILGRLDILKAASHVQPPLQTGPEIPLPPRAQTLGEVMLDELVTVAADTPLAAVIDALVGGGGTRRLIVIDSPTTRQVVGIITDADLVYRVTAPARPGLMQRLRERLVGRGRDEELIPPGLLTAREVMTTPVVTALPSVPISEGIRLMVERGVKVLPVVDAEGRLLGVVNRARLLQALIQD